jgi:hypothetical protein
MTPDAVISLSLDDKGIEEALARVIPKVQAGGSQIGQSFRGASEEGERLLASSHRVAAQMKDTAAQLLSGASGANVFASALEGLEHSLHLPLGALAGLGIGALVIEQMEEAAKKADELHAHIQAAINDPGSADFSSVGELQQHLSDLRKQADDLKEAMGAGIWDRIKTAGGKMGVGGWLETAAGIATGNAALTTAAGEREDQKNEDRQKRDKENLQNRREVRGGGALARHRAREGAI